MTDTDELGSRLHGTLEAHEREVKRTLESLGRVQSAVEAAVDDENAETIPRAALVEIGTQLERHEKHLQTVVETLDDHKRVIRDTENVDGNALADAMKRARQRAHQEGHPPDPTTDGNS